MSAGPGPRSGEALSIAEVLALSSDPIAIFDPEAQFRVANPAALDLLRPVAPYLVPGTPWDVFLLEAGRHGALGEDTCRNLRMMEERLDSPGGPPSLIETLPGGETFSIGISACSDHGFALTFRPTDDPDSDLVAESEVEQLMTKVLQACPTSLTMARIGDGRILYRSPAATELLGKGFNSKEHFAHREERADFITALLPNSRVDDMKITGRGPDGRTFPASISARVIDYRGDEVIVSSMVDLSDELALQDELTRRKEQVFQSEKMSALGELLAGVAHELNNPLSIVVGNAHILLEEEADGPLGTRVEKLADAAERCVRIVRSFLSMARERPLEIELASVESLVSMAVDAFQAGETGDEIEVSVRIDDDLPDIPVDEVQVTQVLTNLLINAGHAMTEAQMGGRVEIEAGLAPNPGFIRIRTTDEGPGVPEDIAGRIFDPLFTTKTGEKGTGVGLALCHRIAIAHGGAISLDPQKSGGASFTLDLPIAQQDSDR